MIGAALPEHCRCQEGSKMSDAGIYEIGEVKQYSTVLKRGKSNIIDAPVQTRVWDRKGRPDKVAFLKI
jgi:hypothetical protein